jgi:hypothetical protein
MTPLAALIGELAASRRRSGGGGTPTVLGYSSNGSSQGGIADGGMFSSKFTLASAGTLTELHAWVDGGGGAGYNVIIHIYADSAGVPGARKAYTSPLATGGGTGVHLSQTGFSVALAAGNYWLGIGCSGYASAGGFKHETTGGTHARYLSGATFNPPPDPWGTSTQNGTRKYSAWAVVNV